MKKIWIKYGGGIETVLKGCSKTIVAVLQLWI